MDNFTKPVVKSKPIRVREMITKTVPTDFLSPIGIDSAKNIFDDENFSHEFQMPKKRAAEQYHEGYVHGKLYLVPDSNLEAMKDIINFKMHPRKSVRYKHQTSFELSDYDQCKSKLNTLLDKIDKVPRYSHEIHETERLRETKKAPSLECTITHENGKEIHETIEVEMGKESVEKEPEEKDPKVKELDEKQGLKHTFEESLEEEFKTESKGNPELFYEEELESESKKEAMEDNVEMEPAIAKPVEPDINPVPTSEVEEYRVRFLISGHFTEGRKPIYVVQQYTGEPNIFENQKTDISSQINGDGHNVFISGKFYSENILEESEGKPIALNIKPNKILINEETSQVYEESFNKLFKVDDINVSLKGEFIQSEITNDITPFVAVGVIKHKIYEKAEQPQLKINKSEENNNVIDQTSTMLLFYSANDGQTCTRNELDLHKELDFDVTFTESNISPLENTSSEENLLLQPSGVL